MQPQGADREPTKASDGPRLNPMVGFLPKASDERLPTQLAFFCGSRRRDASSEPGRSTGKSADASMRELRTPDHRPLVVEGLLLRPLLPGGKFHSLLSWSKRRRPPLAT